ncbi:hypothetical protein NL473_29770, partial [Klebsiella pneumoniae]|nr:hypothetical protein [Klebsiella pneumoniae]MCP6594812.1 hypothetical protein [Klebsiella pneumoniae]
IIDHEMALGFSLYPNEVKTRRMSMAIAGTTVEEEKDGLDSIDAVDGVAAHAAASIEPADEPTTARPAASAPADAGPS